jgi:TonB family protein
MQRIGRYEVVGELGRGAMGIVYEAVDPLIGRTIAIKVIHPQSLTDVSEREFVRDRLFREARSAGSLAHPGIVIIFDVAQDADSAYIAMERVDGPTLQQMLISGPRQKSLEILNILWQTAAALDYAHAHGVIHRDIKPSNLMLQSGMVVKVTDFGIAKITETMHQTQSGIILGTPSYMSPEQINGKPVNGKTDQFSLAVIAFEMLTGIKPFQADSLAALVHMIVYEPRPSARTVNPELPADVDDVLKKGLSQFPEERYESCSDFVAALEAAVQDTEQQPANQRERNAYDNLPSAPYRSEWQHPIAERPRKLHIDARRQPFTGAAYVGFGGHQMSSSSFALVAGCVVVAAVLGTILYQALYSPSRESLKLPDKIIDRAVSPRLAPSATSTENVTASASEAKSTQLKGPTTQGKSKSSRVTATPDVTELATSKIATPKPAPESIGFEVRPSPAETVQPMRVKIPESVMAGYIVEQYAPRYPAEARQAGVQGTVRFTAFVGTDGRVISLEAPNGSPLLLASAKEAALRWRFKPYRQNGRPVEVETQISVRVVPNGR